MISHMPTLSLAVLLLAGHCALARESQVLRRLATTIKNMSGYNDDKFDAITHRRLQSVQDRGFTEVNKIDDNFEVRCNIKDFKSPVLGEYTLKKRPCNGEEYYQNTGRGRSGVTIRLENGHDAYDSDVDEYRTDYANGVTRWVISDSRGYKHFWAPISKNKGGSILPPTTGWKTVPYFERFTTPTFEGKHDECTVICTEFETYPKCPGYYGNFGRHRECNKSAAALTQFPKESEGRDQNEHAAARGLILKGIKGKIHTTILPEPSSPEPDETSSVCSACDGESPTWLVFSCDQCNSTGRC